MPTISMALLEPPVYAGARRTGYATDLRIFATFCRLADPRPAHGQAIPTQAVRRLDERNRPHADPASPESTLGQPLEAGRPERQR